MTTLVGKKAPDFTADAVLPDNSFGKISLSKYEGRYVVLFFYPLDFTFVCPSEIIAFDHKLNEFERRNTAVLGVSVDSLYSHFAWKNTSRDAGGIGNVQFPLIADLDKQITNDYGILADNKVAYRGLFLIDKEGIIRHSVVNDLSLGRNIDEALRMVDALQFTEAHGEVCPAGWKKGDEGMKATADGVAEYLSKHEAEL